MSYFTITKINDSIYQFNDKLSVLATLVIGSEKALLLDTCYGIGNLKEAVLTITKKPLIVVNSHGHMDHSCGNYQFDEVYIDEDDIKLCMYHNSEVYRQRNLNTAISRGILPEDFDKDAYLNKREGNLKIMKEHDIFDLGNLHLEVIKIPGHTIGSVALYIKEQKIMLVSDGACPYVWLFLKESAPLSKYKESLEYLLSYDFDSFLLGHGAGLMQKPFLTRLLELTENALKGIDKDKYEPFTSAGFENPGSVSYCEGRPYEAGKCGIIFNLNNL